MKYEVTTQQGKNFIVDDDDTSLWLDFEEAFDVTFYEAQDKIRRGSISVITKLLFIAAKAQNETELKTHKVWAKEEFKSFDVVGESDPKADAEL